MFNIIVSYIFSFLGSLAPGTVNVNVLQSGLDEKSSVSVRMAAGAAIVEYFYAWIAVRFEMLIKSSPAILTNMQLITAVVMSILGMLIIFSPPRPGKLKRDLRPNGFGKGVLLGVLNPLAIPYWTGATAYFNSQHWIDLATPVGLHSYLLGVSLGVFTILVVIAYGARRLARFFLNRTSNFKKVPGYLLLSMGCLAFVRFFAGIY